MVPADRLLSPYSTWNNVVCPGLSSIFRADAAAADRRHIRFVEVWNVGDMNTIVGDEFDGFEKGGVCDIRGGAPQHRNKF